MKKIFCPECRDDVTYTVVEKELSHKIKDKEYKYTGKVAYCSSCGEEVYVPEINDYNVRALQAVFRTENDLISLEDIQSIPKKYDIGIRPLSQLLGWGELTYTRYHNGDMPSKQYSEILKKIYDSPLYYKELLEQNKANITNVAYEKSLKAVNNLLVNTSNSIKKIDVVDNYILNYCSDVTNLGLQKLLYYVQGTAYMFNNAPIFEDDCEAWAYGPVYRHIYNKYKEYKNRVIDTPDKADYSIFTDEEIKVMDSVLKTFGLYKESTLVDFTHNESPWLIARNNVPDLKRCNTIIDKELIKDYFLAVRKRYNVTSANEIRNYINHLQEVI